jgi:hypothetical protein
MTTMTDRARDASVPLAEGGALRPRRHRRAGRLAALAAAGLLAGACSVSIGEDPDDATSTTVESTTTVVTNQMPEPLEEGTLLDGWIRYEAPPGWELTSAAEGLEATRVDFDDAPVAPTLGAMEPLLGLARTDGTASVALLRERRFLEATDTDAWTEALAADLANDAVELVADEVIELDHGPARRLVFSGLDVDLVLATTEYGEQRLAVVAEVEGGLSDDVGAVLASIQLEPGLVLAPLLQFHAGLAFYDVDGQRAVEIGLHVPSDWAARDAEGAEGVVYASPDIATTVQIYFFPPDGRPLEEVLRTAIEGVPDADPVLVTEERTVDGTPFAVARLGPPELEDVDLGTTWVLVTETDDVVVEIYLDGPDDPDATALLREVISSLTVRVA